MIAACGSQLRIGPTGKPFAIDYGAVMAVGAARAVDIALLSEVLPFAEHAVIAAHHDGIQDGGDDD